MGLKKLFINPIDAIIMTALFYVGVSKFHKDTEVFNYLIINVLNI